ncbi:MAG: DUF4375 domain-containing protein, partial [Paraprevotella sp.]|nr:DUF4375 domain-containing protein [Paraprevotella sp.]
REGVYALTRAKDAGIPSEVLVKKSFPSQQAFDAALDEVLTKYGAEIVKECDEQEFMELFERYSEFDDLDDEFVEMEEEVTATLACYVDEHLELFGEIVEE